MTYPGPGGFTTSADCVEREAAWLATAGDGLPALRKIDGGRWDFVQGDWPRAGSQNQRQSGIYVTCTNMLTTRWANQRRRWTYEFLLKLFWPIGNTTIGEDIQENEQAAMRAGVNDLMFRIHGFMDDHMHGGRFLSVAEAPDPGRVLVRYEDPERAQAAGMLRADVQYSADDHDQIG